MCTDTPVGFCLIQGEIFSHYIYKWDFILEISVTDKVNGTSWQYLSFPHLPGVSCLILWKKKKKKKRRKEIKIRKLTLPLPIANSSSAKSGVFESLTSLCYNLSWLDHVHMFFKYAKSSFQWMHLSIPFASYFSCLSNDSAYCFLTWSFNYEQFTSSAFLKPLSGKSFPLQVHCCDL